MPLSSKSGNAVHKVDKYFIFSTERNAQGKLKLKLSSAAGYGRPSGTEEIKRRVREGTMQLVILSNNEQIKVKASDVVKFNDERYVTDYDQRSVKWAVREMQVFVNPNTNELAVEMNGKIYPLDEFFE